MILSVGLSPAWQKILVFDGMRRGQVNRAHTAKWCASGKVFNAGIAVHTLGGPGLAMAPVGGAAKKPMEEEFQALGMDSRLMETEAPTRVCTTIIDQADGSITELVEEGRPLSIAELERFHAAYREESRRAKVVVMMGSLPQGVPVSFYRELLQEVHRPMVLDFRGEGLLSVLDLHPLVVKPNREELEKTVGYSLNGEQALLDAMRSLNRKGAKWVVITEGTAPVRVSSATEIYRIHPLRIEAERIVNPIGSGDAMAGAMAHAIGNGVINETIENGTTGNETSIILAAVRSGIAAAAQNVRQLLPCRIDPAILMSEAEKIHIERLE
uniref:Phosphofructokinase n=1 Tax=Candidatus Kentrum sp. TUN TaxID=2126343 RepID=A0A450ZUS7_9GAMM|nr:MAG: tagatose 6-phosphate kinase [Candidatus Kentron sp. TUN]VFK62909.1 MAG: tagatose 6-phosphate kinase [Candidatus Kentron sp. TUN]VFK65904.1 MAG: tagatose 6-phosphate kinase [Candidatus Kentron sp. TUN]